MCDGKKKKRGETRTVEEKKGKEGKEVFLWVCVLHNQPSEVMETGRPEI